MFGSFRNNFRPSFGVRTTGETRSSQHATPPASSTQPGSQTQHGQSQRFKPQLGGKGIYGRGPRGGGKGLGRTYGVGITGSGPKRHRLVAFPLIHWRQAYTWKGVQMEVVLLRRLQANRYGDLVGNPLRIQ